MASPNMLGATLMSTTDDATTLAKMKACSHLLPDPGGEALRDCIALAERLLARVPPEGGEADDTGTPGPTPVAPPPVCGRCSGEMEMAAQAGFAAIVSWCSACLPDFSPFTTEAGGVPPSSPDVEAIRGRVAAALEGPWTVQDSLPSGPAGVINVLAGSKTVAMLSHTRAAEAELIARAPTDILAACDLADAARVERDRWRNDYHEAQQTTQEAIKSAEQDDRERAIAVSQLQVETTMRKKAEADLAQAQRELANRERLYTEVHSMMRQAEREQEALEGIARALAGAVDEATERARKEDYPETWAEALDAWEAYATAPTGAQGAQGE